MDFVVTRHHNYYWCGNCGCYSIILPQIASNFGINLSTFSQHGLFQSAAVESLYSS